MAISDLLKSCPLFSELFDKEIEQVVLVCSVFSYGTGTQILTAGQQGGCLFVVLEGDLSETFRDAKGIVMAPTKLRQGAVFGELGFLLDGKINFGDVVSLTKVSILEIHEDAVFKLFEKNPRLFGLLMLNLSRCLARRLKSNFWAPPL